MYDVFKCMNNFYESSCWDTLKLLFSSRLFFLQCKWHLLQLSKLLTFCPLFPKNKLANLFKISKVVILCKKYCPLHHLLNGHLGTEWCNKRRYLTLGIWKQIKSVGQNYLTKKLKVVTQTSPQFVMRMTIHWFACIYQFCLKGIFYQITISFKVTATSYKHTIWTTFQP